MTWPSSPCATSVPSSAIRQSIRLQDVADQRAREVARQAVERGGVFLEEAGDLARHLILLAKSVIRIVVEHRALAVDELHADIHRDQHGRGAPGLGIEGQG